MTRQPDIWNLLVDFMPRNKWLHITIVLLRITPNWIMKILNPRAQRRIFQNGKETLEMSFNIERVLGIFDGIEKRKNIFYLCECLLLLK